MIMNKSCSIDYRVEKALSNYVLSLGDQIVGWIGEFPIFE